MSSYLYALGRFAFRRRRLVLLGWLGVLVLTIALAGVVGGKFDEKFSVPGTESQLALDSLDRTFPQAGGTTAQVVVVVPAGESVRDSDNRSRIEAATKAFRKLPHIDSATSPFNKYAKGVISADNRAAIIMLQVELVDGAVSEASFTAIAQQVAVLQEAIPGSQVSQGGAAYNNESPSFSIVEALGVLIALIVLWLTLGSLRAAGMPLATALLGVLITVLLIFAATGLATVSATTPMLAVMLGLAVGIDYALFITSRHRDQLSAGMEPEESAAQAVATAGSAVVFAGLTVMIALAGLAVARIPFLTTMGVAAAVGVGIAVLIALTLLPALLGFAGGRLRPKQRSVRPPSPRSKRRSVQSLTPGPAHATADQPPRNPQTPRQTLGRRWVRMVTAVPLLTVLIVVVVLGAIAYPAKDLRIALPSNRMATPGSPARVTYDLIDQHYGVGYNGPLIVSATIVGSDDPLKVMDGIAKELKRLPGVASVPLSTPNQNAEVGIVQVIPTGAPDSAETKDLVLRIRSLHQHFLDKYDVPIYVTGWTAVGIDISDRLGAALLPFGLLVVGLSILLLMMVFRSIAVPIKATIGYLLSVLAAFGATSMVFGYGWFNQIFNVHQTGPVMSFLPILLMGILFGLAMDYEVFLVSRMREEYVHAVSRAGAASEVDPRQPIEDGFVASARVVVAAAVIMFAVFAAFVPEGEGPIKTISFGLAVGVFIDAFVVRMTFVPAVMRILGHRAWWLPAWIDRRLPRFDVEGAGLAHQLALRDWPTADDDRLLVASGVSVPGVEKRLETSLRSGEIVVIEGPVGSGKSAVLLTLTGRMQVRDGRLKVLGLVLPQQAGQIRRRTALIDCRRISAERRQPGLRGEIARARKAGAAVIAIDHIDSLAAVDDWAALASLVEETPGSAVGLLLAVRDRSRLADLIAVPCRYEVLAVAPGQVAQPVGSSQLGE